MSINNQIPDPSQLVDHQFFQIPVAAGALIGYLWDLETKTLYAKESQIIIPSRHGLTHIAEDLVPSATCDSPGLMAADDKCKLDALLQMRIGVLGYSGAGWPEDNGFLSGDIILASGSEFISIERIGNTIRFNVENMQQLSCGCETCAQIFWIADESAVRAIRPPSCNGVLPDVHGYGALRIYSFPQSTILDPTDPLATLNQKGNYPALIFQPYVNAVTPFENSFEVVLKRNSDLTSHTGWAFTPGSLARAQCVWMMGKDSQGGQIKFELWTESDPNLLGSVLYRGHLITKKMAVITDYNAAVLNNNQYVLRLWDIQNANPIGNPFTATNIWRYANPENSATAVTNPKKLILDSTVDILPIGTLVDIWEFEINRTADNRLTRAYFCKQPQLNPASLWSYTAGVQFGDLFVAREELIDLGSTGVDINVADKRQFERTIWGCNNFEERLILSDDGGEAESSDGHIQREPSGEPVNNDIVADVDPALPGLRIIKQTKSLIADINNDGIVNDEDLRLFMCAFNHTIFEGEYNPRADFNQDGKVDIRDLAVLGQQFDLNLADKIPDRPIFLWHRGLHKNVLVRSQIGMPTGTGSPPYDFLLSAPVDNFEDIYMKVLRRGVLATGPFAGAPYIVVKGAAWKDLPSEGTLCILTGAFRNVIWKYFFKCAFSNWDDDAIMLIGRTQVFPFDEDFPIGEAGLNCTAVWSGMPEGSGGGSGSEGPYAPEVPINTTVTELLRQDFTSPCVRFQFIVNHTTGQQSVQLQVKVGILDMSLPYECSDQITAAEDMVRGLAPGYTVSKAMIQNGFISDGIGAGVTSTPTGFRIYTGGELPVPVSGQVEKWNDVEIMLRDGQIWCWINGLLVPPDTVASANLPVPVAVNTPYFPIRPQVLRGKVAMRMFPGALLRSMDVNDQLSAFNEFSHQQLELIG